MLNHVATLVTAIGVTITAVGGLIVSVTILLPQLRLSKNTHALVNQQHTDITNYNRALIRALKSAGIDVPIDQSFPEEPDSPL